MEHAPSFQLAATVLDCPDPRRLAAFYQRLLGWPVRDDEPEWVTLRPAGGGPGLSFQLEPFFRRPTWPSTVDHQQMMLHLDLRVDDLAGAEAHAVAAGATLAQHQPQNDVRVYLDPAGHPFCLFQSPSMSTVDGG